MNPVKRRAEIVTIIRKQNRVSVDELAQRLNISRETIRRDLSELSQSGKVHKFHGGASMPRIIGEGPFLHRMSEHVAEKVRIADQALKLVSPGETLFLDTGSTTLYFAEKLTEISNITVVTNSAEIARTLSLGNPHTKTFLLGGEFNGDNRQTIGTIAIEQIRSFRAHHAFLTIGALDARTGIMDFCINEAQIARNMIKQAESVTVLADQSKFERIASFEVCSLPKVNNLVCDALPSGSIHAALLEAGVSIIVAAE
jgi:DeoR family glycerol-3-phosphate regulon repressor